MQIKKLLSTAVLALVLVSVQTSCHKNLDQKPYYELSNETVFNDFANYRSVLAKLYGGLTLTGQDGPSGKPDVAGIDEGYSSYIRCMWKMQTLPTDEAICGWGDPGLPALSYSTWGAGNEWSTAMYYRIFYQITLCNTFIRELTDENLTRRGITGADADLARQYRAEARFMRALSYYHALDFYRNVPFVTETSSSTDLPEQKNTSDIFTYIETELKDIENTLLAPRSNEYGRADRAAAWMLLAKLYLNADVYVSSNRASDALTYSKKVIDAGYALAPKYGHNFLADNNTSPELIFTSNFDGASSRSYGGTTLLTHAAVGGSMSPKDFGIDGGWGGFRTTPQFVDKFADPTGATDSRAMFYTDGQNKQIENFGKFTDGFAISKWRNVTRAGVPGKDLTFVDIDFPIFRLADAYLMYAEAHLRGGGGSAGEALGYVNMLRERAYGNTSGNVAAADFNLDFILDERAREMYWEGGRRTDLIRFGKFTGNSYLWAFKGGVAEGASIPTYRAVYPIPSQDMAANPSLKQNPGY
jgi:starch-binding outer membrane protein, SusD/RagB family